MSAKEDEAEDQALLDLLEEASQDDALLAMLDDDATEQSTTPKIKGKAKVRASTSSLSNMRLGGVGSHIAKSGTAMHKRRNMHVVICTLRIDLVVYNSNGAFY